MAPGGTETSLVGNIFAPESVNNVSLFDTPGIRILKLLLNFLTREVK